MPPTEALEDQRAAITGHCYRMLGSAIDAEDAVQETMLRAWRSLDRFEARASVRTWLHRIATNVCLDMLARQQRRTRPIIDGPVGTVDDPLEARDRSHWIEPIPDAWVLGGAPDPAERMSSRESIRLAFVTTLQQLPPKQRAALLLTEVVGLSAAEAADTLETSLASINSAVQRARAKLSQAAPEQSQTANDSLSATQAQLVDRFVLAFESYDVDALTALMHEDATLCMPPYTLWLRGRDSIGSWLRGHGIGCRGSRLIATAACGAPAFGQYRPDPAGGHRPWALVVLELRGGAIDEMISFLDTEALFPKFGLPDALPPTD
ncbi:sigma-70 family RNA polymerase sigma factor [Enhygromyxa salina]|uniref:ECF RNA polymerase sigma factor SigG n=1 Tax=Enhygromyxa salina TaxID=215803 RepID=A0A2S9YNQ6_9BACT|nr:sigma-70 family RNA polymerase sigma factor [Enhygromyxa salina]PRQ06718.1 ECF RNA polymerase sigma factor SigG [Enhygromyxa salina]